MSSSQLHFFEQCTSPDNDEHPLPHRCTLGTRPSDQGSRSILQSFQSEVASLDEGAWNSSTNLETIFGDEVQTTTPAKRQVSDQEYAPHSQEFVSTHMARLELLFSHTPVSAGYELGTQQFQFTPEYSTSEGQTFSHSSASRHQELRVPVVQGGQEKVRCTWPGCLRIVNEDNHARHVDETHLGKVRDVCTSCGRVFPRMYTKRNHICHGPHSKRRRS
ncbi:hypothetical protein K503DRAFT_773192 [Rhizopogon vinicolor AM-OR11-026]|uniref:C2H2-type domain-containing protein n=1 Tax=Rhizopogon vinicolor AM-OR11-026 TaxID=1314800 RepID=A0A1B7MSY0_9AGAM|nr:hypothetical protein K503DRAFT_773192 [Rhizopogon vinicolor AM-OR11-026]